MGSFHYGGFDHLEAIANEVNKAVRMDALSERSCKPQLMHSLAGHMTLLSERIQQTASQPLHLIHQILLEAAPPSKDLFLSAFCSAVALVFLVSKRSSHTISGFSFKSHTFIPTRSFLSCSLSSLPVNWSTVHQQIVMGNDCVCINL